MCGDLGGGGAHTHVPSTAELFVTGEKESQGCEDSRLTTLCKLLSYLLTLFGESNTTLVVKTPINKGRYIFPKHFPIGLAHITDFAQETLYCNVRYVYFYS